MSRSKLLLTAILLGTLAVATACGADDQGGEAEPAPPAQSDATAPTATTDPRCGPVPPNLRGTYRTEIRPEDVTPEVSDIRTGESEMTLGPGHQGRTDRVDLEPVCVMGDVITFPEEPAGGACSGYGPGIYRWHLRDGDLILEKIKDDCVYSAFHHTVHPWTRVEAGTG